LCFRLRKGAQTIFWEIRIVLNDLLFEIHCAEQIGNFRLADALDNRLKRIATADRKIVQKQIEKKFSQQIKSLDYSPSQNKFIISVDASVPNNLKRDIKQLADPFGVSFKYSEQHKNIVRAQHKNIDELIGNSENIDDLIGTSSVDPLNRHLESLNDYSGEHIGIDELDDMEPTDEDLRFEEEFPADELSNDPNSMDSYWLDHAKRDINKLLQ
jgi:hypothetical protein